MSSARSSRPLRGLLRYKALRVERSVDECTPARANGSAVLDAMDSANPIPHGASVSAGSSVLGGAESLSRRRAISNIGRIVNGLRNSSSSRPRNMRSASGGAHTHAHAVPEDSAPYSFLLPHERRRVVRSDPVPPSFSVLDFSAPLPFFGSSSSPTDGSRRNWRRGRRIPKGHQHDIERRESSASARSMSATAPTPSVSTSAPPLGVGDPCGASDLTYSSASDEADAKTAATTKRRPPARSERTDIYGTSSEGVAADNGADDARSEHGEGGYASFTFDRDDARRCGGGCADRDEVAALRLEMAASIREMRDLQDKYYIMLNASLQENFQATGALESRVDQFVSRGANASNSPLLRSVHGTRPSTVLMWTVVDAFSAVMLWLISALIARPYEAFRRIVRVKEDAEEILVSRKSWRLSASKDMKTEYDRFAFGPPRRLSFREAEQWGQ